MVKFQKVELIEKYDQSLINSIYFGHWQSKSQGGLKSLPSIKKFHVLIQGFPKDSTDVHVVIPYLGDNILSMWRNPVLDDLFYFSSFYGEYRIICIPVAFYMNVVYGYFLMFLKSNKVIKATVAVDVIEFIVIYFYYSVKNIVYIITKTEICINKYIINSLKKAIFKSIFRNLKKF